MKTLTYIFALLLLVACSTAPEIIPDSTVKSNVVINKLNHAIQNPGTFSGNWGWILWYLPIVGVVGVWAWRKFIKECPECGKSEEKSENP